MHEHESELRRAHAVGVPPTASRDERLALVESKYPDVAAWVLEHETDAEIIAAGARAHPDLSEFIARNPYAEPALKDSLPIGMLDSYSIERYLDDRRANLSQRIALLREYDQASGPAADRTHTPTIGDVWRAVAATAAGDA